MNRNKRFKTARHRIMGMTAVPVSAVELRVLRVELEAKNRTVTNSTHPNSTQSFKLVSGQTLRGIIVSLGKNRLKARVMILDVIPQEVHEVRISDFNWSIIVPVDLTC